MASPPSRPNGVARFITHGGDGLYYLASFNQQAFCDGSKRLLVTSEKRNGKQDKSHKSFEQFQDLTKRLLSTSK